MACNIERPSAQALFNRHLSMFSGTVLGGASVIPESNEWYAVTVNYAIAEEFYAIAEQAWKEKDPRTACYENLVQMAYLDGVYPAAATMAQGYVKLHGVGGTAITAPLTFSIDGQSFVTADADSQPLYLGPTGEAVIRVRATVAGADGNVVADTGTLNSAPADVSSTVELCGGQTCGGSDIESEDAFRARYVQRLQYKPRATNAWLMDKISSWPCVTRVLQRGGSCCNCDEDPAGCTDCGCSDCGGKLEFYAMMDGSFSGGAIPPSVAKEIEDWVFGKPQGFGLGEVELGVCGRIYPVTPVAANVYVDIQSCPTRAELVKVRAYIEEFFTTTVPSEPVTRTSISLIVQNVLGDNAVFDVRFELVNPDYAYGPDYGGETSTSRVYQTECELEPDCDYVIVLGELFINRSAADLGECS